MVSMIINKIGSVLLLALFFIPSLFAAPLKVGVLDTGFCNKEIEVYNATKEDLNDFCKLKMNHPSLHGQLVVAEFLKHSPKEIELYPIVIFNKHGKQKLSFWVNAIKYAQKMKLDVLLIAAGFPGHKKVTFPSFSILSFVASGTREGKISKDTFLYPQENHKMKNIILIGSYSPSRFEKVNDAMVDSRRMYPAEIDYYMPGDKNGSLLNGSSKAVAVALGKALKACPLKSIKRCLDKKKKYIDVLNSLDPLPTF
jgi:hypothetical protein